MFACKLRLKYWLSALFLQEYTARRTGGILTFAGGKRKCLEELKNTRISKGPRVIVQ